MYWGAVEVTTSDEVAAIVWQIAAMPDTRGRLDVARSFRRVYAAEVGDEQAAANIGFVAGDAENEGDYFRVLVAFKVRHPHFGQRYPSPNEAFAAGGAYARRVAGGSPPAAETAPPGIARRAMRLIEEDL